MIAERMGVKTCFLIDEIDMRYERQRADCLISVVLWHTSMGAPAPI